MKGMKNLLGWRKKNQRIDEIFNKPMPLGTGDYYRGYKDCFEQLKQQIYIDNREE